MDPESPSMEQSDEQRQLERLREEILAEFGQRLPTTVVDARFEAIVRDFEQAPVRSFIPVLARRRLRLELASAQD